MELRITAAFFLAVCMAGCGSTAHTATSNNGAFDTGTISAGAQVSKQFNTAGSFPYHCTFHPGMVATINVQ